MLDDFRKYEPVPMPCLLGVSLIPAEYASLMTPEYLAGQSRGGGPRATVARAIKGKAGLTPVELVQLYHDLTAAPNGALRSSLAWIPKTLLSPLFLGLGGYAYALSVLVHGYRDTLQELEPALLEHARSIAEPPKIVVRWLQTRSGAFDTVSRRSDERLLLHARLAAHAVPDLMCYSSVRSGTQVNDALAAAPFYARADFLVNCMYLLRSEEWPVVDPIDEIDSLATLAGLSNYTLDSSLGLGKQDIPEQERKRVLDVVAAVLHLNKVRAQRISDLVASWEKENAGFAIPPQEPGA